MNYQDLLAAAQQTRRRRIYTLRMAYAAPEYAPYQNDLKTSRCCAVRCMTATRQAPRPLRIGEQLPDIEAHIAADICTRSICCNLRITGRLPEG
jgi:hypothetical protein